MVLGGVSGKSILRTLRESGLGYRDSTFYADARILHSAQRGWEAMQEVSAGRVIPARFYVPPDRPLEKDYAYVIRGQHYEPVTQELSSQYGTIYSDVPLSRNELFDLAEEFAETSPIDLERGVEVVEAYH